MRFAPAKGVIRELADFVVLVIVVDVLLGLAPLAAVIVGLSGGSGIAVWTAFALPCAASVLVLAVRMAGGSLSTTLAAGAIPLVALLVVVLAAVEP